MSTGLIIERGGTLWIRGELRGMGKKSNRKQADKKQRRDLLAGIHHIIAALYYLVKLILLFLGK